MFMLNIVGLEKLHCKFVLLILLFFLSMICCLASICYLSVVFCWLLFLFKKCIEYCFYWRVMLNLILKLLFIMFYFANKYRISPIILHFCQCNRLYIAHFP